jgi:DNA-nicking Smr family endonuclease
LEPVQMPIDGTLDLHTFKPGDVPELLEDYFNACVQAGIYSVRVIHGKGSGTLKKRVQALLKKNALVAAFKDAPPEAGGWGATLVVTLSQSRKPYEETALGLTDPTR